MLGAQSAAAVAALALKEATADPGVAGGGGGGGAAAAAVSEEEMAAAPLPAAPAKKRGGRGSRRTSAYPEQDYTVKTGACGRACGRWVVGCSVGWGGAGRWID